MNRNVQVIGLFFSLLLLVQPVNFHVPLPVTGQENENVSVRNFNNDSFSAVSGGVAGSSYFVVQGFSPSFKTVISVFDLELTRVLELSNLDLNLRTPIVVMKSSLYLLQRESLTKIDIDSGVEAWSVDLDGLISQLIPQPSFKVQKLYLKSFDGKLFFGGTYFVESLAHLFISEISEAGEVLRSNSGLITRSMDHFSGELLVDEGGLILVYDQTYNAAPGRLVSLIDSSLNFNPLTGYDFYDNWYWDSVFPLSFAGNGTLSLHTKEDGMNYTVRFGRNVASSIFDVSSRTLAPLSSPYLLSQMFRLGFGYYFVPLMDGDTINPSYLNLMDKTEELIGLIANPSRGFLEFLTIAMYPGENPSFFRPISAFEIDGKIYLLAEVLDFGKSVVTTQFLGLALIEFDFSGFLEGVVPFHFLTWLVLFPIVGLIIYFYRRRKKVKAVDLFPEE